MTIGWAILIVGLGYLMVNYAGARKTILLLGGAWALLAFIAIQTGNQTASVLVMLPLMPFLH